MDQVHCFFGENDYRLNTTTENGGADSLTDMVHYLYRDGDTSVQRNWKKWSKTWKRYIKISK